MMLFSTSLVIPVCLQKCSLVLNVLALCLSTSESRGWGTTLKDRHDLSKTNPRASLKNKEKGSKIGFTPTGVSHCAVCSAATLPSLARPATLEGRFYLTVIRS